MRSVAELSREICDFFECALKCDSAVDRTTTRCNLWIVTSKKRDYGTVLCERLKVSGSQSVPVPDPRTRLKCPSLKMKNLGISH